MLEAIKVELEQRASYLKGALIETVYFGGGTPSLLTVEEINALWEVIAKHYNLAAQLEVTLESNPDDLSAAYLLALRQTPINRLSIGVQSFFEEDLQFMNRVHNAEEAKKCILQAQEVGFNELTIDLIYGASTTTMSRWEQNLAWVFEQQIPHLSCYALTVEPKTALAHFVDKGKVAAPSDELAAAQFEFLLAALVTNGYEQYEISNFCRPPHYAQHNTNYWKGKAYLGVGPAAHSFDGGSRRWNVANNAHYIKAIHEGTTYWETETLTAAEQYNEYIMTALRTKWGVEKTKLAAWPTWKPIFEAAAAPFLASGQLLEVETAYKLSDEGKLLTDYITAALFADEED